MSYERALQWLQKAKNSEAWGYLPGGTPRGEPTVWACAAGVQPPLSWMQSNDLAWSVLAAPAALSMQPDLLSFREELVQKVLSLRGEQVPEVTHVDGTLEGWSWYS